MDAEEENKAVRVLQLLTHKPLTYAANVGEGDLVDSGQSNSQVQALKQKALEENCEVVVVSAQVKYRVFSMKQKCSKPKRKYKTWSQICLRRVSITLPRDLQSHALPTELQRQMLRWNFLAAIFMAVPVFVPHQI